MTVVGNIICNWKALQKKKQPLVLSYVSYTHIAIAYIYSELAN